MQNMCFHFLETSNNSSKKYLKIVKKAKIDEYLKTKKISEIGSLSSLIQGTKKLLRKINFLFCFKN